MLSITKCLRCRGARYQWAASAHPSSKDSTCNEKGMNLQWQEWIHSLVHPTAMLQLPLLQKRRRANQSNNSDIGALELYKYAIHEALQSCWPKLSSSNDLEVSIKYFVREFYTSELFQIRVTALHFNRFKFWTQPVTLWPCIRWSLHTQRK